MDYVISHATKFRNYWKMTYLKPINATQHTYFQLFEHRTSCLKNINVYYNSKRSKHANKYLTVKNKLKQNLIGRIIFSKMMGADKIVAVSRNNFTHFPVIKIASSGKFC